MIFVSGCLTRIMRKVVVLSGSSTLKADDSGMQSSSVGWQDNIDMGQIQTV